MIESPITLREAFWWWLKLGFISFGGPAGQISIMHQELVERRRWISENRFLHALNYCMVLPGPEAQQLATYIGWLMHGTWGGLIAGGLFVLPSFFILVALSWIYLAYDEVAAVAGVFYGIKPVVIALVAHAAWRMGKRTLRSPALGMLAVAAFTAIAVFDAPFPLIVIAAALLGLLGSRFAPLQFQAAAAHSHMAAARGPALVDDDTPTPAHARFSRTRFVACLAIGLGLWMAGMALLVIHTGVDGVLSQLGWFFSKAAILTFGGAYAVLPYVHQAAVEHFGWLSAGQMLDGLALGESTPGPLIMVVAFVGFVAGWQAEIFGPGLLLWAGIAGASVACFFTFLPSFLFIFLGAPLVEASRSEMRLTAPFAAVTAAVVGVIANLAVFLAWHVFWPRGGAESPDFAAMGIALIAGCALFLGRAGVMPVLLFGMLAGLLHAFV
jgi:chromate transporter